MLLYGSDRLDVSTKPVFGLSSSCKALRRSGTRLSGAAGHNLTYPNNLDKLYSVCPSAYQGCRNLGAFELNQLVLPAERPLGPTYHFLEKHHRELLFWMWCNLVNSGYKLQHFKTRFCVFVHEVFDGMGR
jgi:hypothetical protein